MYKAQQQYNVTGHEGVTETWNIMQNEVSLKIDLTQSFISSFLRLNTKCSFYLHQVHCCGVKGYTDWANTTFSKGLNVPDSCCIEYTVGCGVNMILSQDADERLYTVGCVPELSEQVNHKAGVFAGIGVGVACIQVKVDWCFRHG